MMAIIADYIDNFMVVFMDNFSFLVLPLMCLANLSIILKRYEEVNLVLS